MSDMDTINKENNKGAAIFLIVAAAIIACIALVVMRLGNGNDTTSENTVEVQRHELQVVYSGENMIIPVGEVVDTAHFYPVEVDGTEMEVIAIRDSRGNIRTAFNTCQTCYDSGYGYYLPDEDNNLICQNCGYKYAADQVEVEAMGCNPYPIFKDNKTVTDDSILISYDYLKEAEAIFANWRNK